MTKIYHYTKLGTAIEHILPKLSLRTSGLDKMNDPKENQPWAFGGRNIDYKSWYPESYNNDTHIEHQKKLGLEIKASCQALCFVKDKPKKGYLNEIMWAHYAENHKGICIELDKDRFIQENTRLLSDYAFESVNYGIHKRVSMIASNGTKREEIDRIVKVNYKELFYKKSRDWKTENEVRLLTFNSDQLFLSIKESLTGLYLGLSFPYNYLPSIDYLIDTKQTKVYELFYEDGKIKKMESVKGRLKS